MKLRALVLVAISMLVFVGCQHPQEGSIQCPLMPAVQVVALGDSITAGYMLAPEQSYPSQLAGRLAESGCHNAVLNFGVSGNKTADVLSRLSTVPADSNSIIVLEIGVNDSSHGVPVSTLTANLDAIIAQLQAKGARVILAGITLWPGYPPDIYTTAADSFHLALILDILTGVEGDPDLELADLFHPNAAGAAIVAETVLRALSQ